MKTSCLYAFLGENLYDAFFDENLFDEELVDRIEDDPGDAEGDKDVTDGKREYARDMRQEVSDVWVDEKGIGEPPSQIHLGEYNEQK